MNVHDRDTVPSVCFMPNECLDREEPPMPVVLTEAEDTSGSCGITLDPVQEFGGG